jgi:Fic family protein
MDLKILKYDFINEFTERVKDSPMKTLLINERIDIPVDYFEFYNSISSVYSSRIEGENIDFDSYFKHKFLNVKYQPNYTKKADDLFAAYEFIYKNTLNDKNLFQAHSILSSNLLPKSQQGFIRNNPMYVINKEDRIEYVAAEPNIVKQELDKLFLDIDLLLNKDLSDFEVFYFASYIHLVFVKIHPFQDGNGRTARLLEKWFLISKLGDKATAVQLEKNYYKKLDNYYANIKKLGIEYNELNYHKCLDFLFMTVECLKEN